MKRLRELQLIEAALKVDICGQARALLEATMYGDGFDFNEFAVSVANLAQLKQEYQEQQEGIHEMEQDKEYNKTHDQAVEGNRGGSDYDD